MLRIFVTAICTTTTSLNPSSQPSLIPSRRVPLVTHSLSLLCSTALSSTEITISSRMTLHRTSRRKRSLMRVLRTRRRGPRRRSLRLRGWVSFPATDVSMSMLRRSGTWSRLCPQRRMQTRWLRNRYDGCTHHMVAHITWYGADIHRVRNNWGSTC